MIQNRYDSFVRDSIGVVERDRNGRAILKSDLLCHKCRLIMSPIAGGEKQCTYCSSRQGFSPHEYAEAKQELVTAIKDTLMTWVRNKSCSMKMHFYETFEKDEGKEFSIFTIPVKTSTLYRTCSNCDKTQRMEWLIWRDVHDIPPAKVLDDSDKTYIR